MAILNEFFAIKIEFLHCCSLFILCCHFDYALPRKFSHFERHTVRISIRGQWWRNCFDIYSVCFVFSSFFFLRPEIMVEKQIKLGIYLNQKQSIKRSVEVVTAIKQFAWREKEIRLWCRDNKIAFPSYDNQLLCVWLPLFHCWDFCVAVR